MKLAYFINQYPKASHTFIRREILELEKTGINITRIALRYSDDQVIDKVDHDEKQATHYILKNNLLVIILKFIFRFFLKPITYLMALKLTFQLSSGSRDSIFNHLIRLVEASELVHLTKKEGITHIHGHFGTNTAEILLISKFLSGLSYSFTVHGPEEFDYPEALHLREKIFYADFVVAITNYCRSQLYRWSSSNCWQKIHIIRCGIDKDFYDGKLTVLPESNSFVCVGRLCEQKGQKLLVQACYELKETGIPFHLTLAGDGEDRVDLEKLIDDFGLREYITITGWISSREVCKLITESRYSILTSFAEGLPVVIMEAMFLSRPVISTYIAGIPELVENNKSGFLIYAGCSKEIFRVMNQAIHTNSAKLKSMTENALIRVKHSHDISTEVSKLRELFISYDT